MTGVALAVALTTSLVATAPVNAADSPGATIVAAVEKVCLPLIGGQSLQTVAAAATAGAVRDNVWTASLPNRGEIRIRAPGAANPRVCSASISFSPGGHTAFIAALDAWAAAHAPPLRQLRRRDPSRTADLQYWISSWTGAGGGRTTNLVFTEQAELDGRPTDGALMEAVLLVNVTP